MGQRSRKCATVCGSILLFLLLIEFQTNERNGVYLKSPSRSDVDGGAGVGNRRSLTAIDFDQPNDVLDEASPPLLFHVVVTKPHFSTLNLRSFESIFHFHPKAQLHIHSNVNAGFLRNNSLPEQLVRLQHMGYHIESKTYTIPGVVNEIVTLSNVTDFDENSGSAPDVVPIDVVAAGQWLSRLAENEKGRHWYSHETDFVRLFLMYVYGGIYIDTDVILVRPMVPVAGREDGLAVETAIATDNSEKTYNCAVLKFLHKGNTFIAHALNEYFRTYKGYDWDYNGPQLLRRVIKAYPEMECAAVEKAEGTNETTSEAPSAASCQVHLLPPLSFQPVPWNKWGEYCFVNSSDSKLDFGRSFLDNPNVHVVHMNNKATGARIDAHDYLPDSLCDHVLERFKVIA